MEKESTPVRWKLVTDEQTWAAYRAFSLANGGHPPARPVQSVQYYAGYAREELIAAFELRWTLLVSAVLFDREQDAESLRRSHRSLIELMTSMKIDPLVAVAKDCDFLAVKDRYLRELEGVATFMRFKNKNMNGYGNHKESQ